MNAIDWSSMRPRTRQPTRQEKALYLKWMAHLQHSKLDKEEQHIRAANFAELGIEP